jgi:hypothetical protein
MNAMVKSLLMGIVLRNRLTPQTVAEAEAAKVYVHAVKDARLAAIGITAYFASIVAMITGLSLLILGIVYKSSDTPVQSLMTAALVLGAIMFILPLIAFVVGLSERMVVKVSKIDKLVDRVARDSVKAQNAV